MKTWQLVSNTGPDSLQMLDTPTPEPKPGEVLVHVKANSLNYRDLMVCEGVTEKQRYPLFLFLMAPALSLPWVQVPPTGRSGTESR